jgi:hypothetical protein
VRKSADARRCQVPDADIGIRESQSHVLVAMPRSTNTKEAQTRQCSQVECFSTSAADQRGACSPCTSSMQRHFGEDIIADEVSPRTTS